MIEVCESSKHLDFILYRLQQLDKTYQKRLEFLHTFYFMCVYEVRYENPIFQAKLKFNAHKKIIFKKLYKTEYKRDRKKVFLDYYTLLESSEFDSLKSIRQKYLKLAKEYHPDRVAQKSSQEIKRYTEKFLKIKEAYDFIKLRRVA